MSELVPSRVFLIGYRGTGKSTVARLLAERLRWDWIDADALLEARAGMTIRQIFAAEGETGFRERESLVLAELGGKERHVIATGGGVILRPANRQLIQAGGLVVWLTADPATIWDRLQSDATTANRRPTLTVGGRAEIEQLLREREPYYRACAHIAADTVARPPAAVADEIHRRLAAFLVPSPARGDGTRAG
jgi:shikimate kinase